MTLQNSSSARVRNLAHTLLTRGRELVFCLAFGLMFLGGMQLGQADGGGNAQVGFLGYQPISQPAGTLVGDIDSACQMNAGWGGRGYYLGIWDIGSPGTIECWHAYMAVLPVLTTNVFVVCSDGWFVVGLTCAKQRRAADCATCDGTNPAKGDPVQISTGNKFEDVTDFSTGGIHPLEFKRSFRSLHFTSPGTLGLNWGTNYDRWIVASGSAPTSLTVYQEKGSIFGFAKSGSVWSRSDTDTVGNITEITAGSIYEFTTGDDRTDRFSRVGTTTTYRLVQTRWRDGYQQNLTYDAAGHLSTVVDSYGRTLTFGWTLNPSSIGGGRITSVNALGTHLIRLDYSQPVNAAGSSRFGYTFLLSKVTSSAADGSSPQSHGYLYEDPMHVGFITGELDGKGNRFATTTYDVNGRVLSTELAGGAGRISIAYDDVNNTRSVTNELGKTAVYHFSGRQGMFKLDSVDEQLNASCSTAVSGVTYDSNGFVASKTDCNGNKIDYQRDAQGRETSRTEAVGKPEQRTITTSWHASYNVPTKIVAPGKTTDFAWDSSGHLTQRTETDTTGGASNGQVRTWSFTWSATGQLLSVDGPRTEVSDLTAYTYDVLGNLSSVTNALNQATQITAVSDRGLPLSIQDSNGIVTDFSYDAEGRIKSRTLHGATDLTTEFSYDDNGSLSSITLPNGTSLTYEYDAAHRQTAIQNSLGERIEYTLDAMGNRTARKIKSGTGAILRLQSQVFDELGRMLQNIGAANQTTSYQYDNNGNLVQLTDPRSAVTQQAFDGLNRVVSLTDSINGQTQLAYDAQDNVTQVSDPKSQATTYTYNAWSDLISQQSPDTGTISFTVDTGGNRISQTDSRGVVTNFQYDALNRMTQKSFPAHSNENVSFAYDSTANGNRGIGHLTSVTDEAGSSAYIYDASGNLTSEARLIGTATYETDYSYDSLGNLIKLRYPTGRIVTYDRDGLGRIASVHSQSSVAAAPVVLAANIQYLPFGPVSSLTFGNGLQLTYQYDQDYRLTHIVTAGNGGNLQDLTLTYDGSDNVTAITDAVTATRSQSFQYDLLRRLTQAQGAYGTEGYTLDAIGNRLEKTITANGTTATVTQSYATGSSRLTSASDGSNGRSFIYDSAGNLASESLNGALSYTYTYNDSNRLSQVAVAGGDTVGYTYNAFGERQIRAIANGDTHHLQYGPNGELITETDAQGNAVKSYVYLDSLPIAMINPTSGGSGGNTADLTVDDSDSGVTSSGTWASSSSGTGYNGSGHRLHATPDPISAGGTVIDNGGTGFSTSGNWSTMAGGTGVYGANYLQRNRGNGQPITVDDADAAFSISGAWSTQTDPTNLYGQWIGSTYRYKAPNGESALSTVLDNSDPTSGFTTTGNWTLTNESSGQIGPNDLQTYANVLPGSAIVDNSDPSFRFTGAPPQARNSYSGQYLGTNWYYIQPNGPSNQVSVIDDGTSGFSMVGTWDNHSIATCNLGTCFTQGPATITAQATIVDNGSANFSSTSTTWGSISRSDCIGGNCLAHGVDGTATATWQLPVQTAGQYKVWAHWPTYSDLTHAAPFTIYSDSGATTILEDQQYNQNRWVLLGIFNLTPGQSNRVVLGDPGNAPVSADAIAFEPNTVPVPKMVWQLPVQTAGQYKVWTRWHSWGDSSHIAPFTVYSDTGASTVAKDQSTNSDSWQLLGVYNLTPGQNDRVELTNLGGAPLTSDAVAVEPVNVPTNSAIWTPSLPVADQYRIYARWTSDATATNATYKVTYDGGTATVTVDQTQQRGLWVYLGMYPMTPGQGQNVALSDQANGWLVADSVAFEPASNAVAANKATWTLNVPQSGQYLVWALWRRSGAYFANNATYSIYGSGGTRSQVVVNQAQAGASWVLLGTYNLDAGNGNRIELGDHDPTGALVSGQLQADAIAVESVSSLGNATTWTPTIPVADKYEVFGRWTPAPSGPAMASNARYTITHGGVIDTVTVDQTRQSGGWISLGRYDFTPGTGDKIQLSDHANGSVVADAIQLRPVDHLEHFATWRGTATNAGTYQLYARWPVMTGLAPDAKYRVTTPTGISTVSVNQQLDGGNWHLLGNVALAANDAWQVDLSDQASGPVAADAVALVPAGAADSFTWTPTLPTAGKYQVYASWSSDSDRARDATYQIHATGAVSSVTVDQTQSANGWRYLGSYDFDPANAPSISLLSSLTGSVSADAIRLVGSGNAAGINFILSDQVGQPQKLTDGDGNLIWDRVSTPYGETVDLQNPGNLDQLLRFPGQQLDPTTSLAYNYYRDYDASLGRYIQSDPIGLNGGLNTYAYVGGNPVEGIDPLGLVDLNLFPVGSDQYNNSNTVSSPAGTYTVGAHGNPWKILDSNGKTVTAQQLADMIKADKHYKQGEPVRLDSCNTGVTPILGIPSFAQKLANQLGAPVLAPNNFAWIYSNRTPVVAPYGGQPNVTWLNESVSTPNTGPSANHQGSYVSFYPGQ